MKILYVGTDVDAKGGIPRYSRYQVQALRGAWGEGAVRVFSLCRKEDDAFEEVLAIHHYGGGTALASKLRFSASVVAHAARWRPDVVLANHISLSPVAAVAARAARGMAVLNVYGHEVWSGLRPRDRYGLQRSHRIIADCHFTSRYVASDLSIPGDRIVTVWDCVDVDRFTPGEPAAGVPERYGIPPRDGRLTLMTLGRPFEDQSHKGFHRLIQMMAKLPADAPVRYVVAGDGPSRPALERRAREPDLAGRVFLTGSIHERDLADVYRACDVLALVSDRGKGRGEGVPLAVLEAAACGKPVLVGNQDGSQEAVVEGDNGFILDPFDLDALCDRVLRLAADPALRARMGAAARARVEKEHAFDVFARRTIDAITSARRWN
jgi:phosphatidylinositol alpha-1,6-mannosyltransferase